MSTEETAGSARLEPIALLPDPMRSVPLGEVIMEHRAMLNQLALQQNVMASLLSRMQSNDTGH